MTLDGTLDMTQNYGATTTIINGLTLNGTIELGGTSGTNNYASLNFGMPATMSLRPSAVPGPSRSAKTSTITT